METENKSLLQLWRNNIPKLRKDSRNTLVILIGAAAFCLALPFSGTHDFTSTLSGFCATLAGIWASILGFVIAGFAIFTAMSPDFLLALWKYKESHSKLPHLEVRLLIFIKLFVSLMFGLFVFMFIYFIAIFFPDPLRDMGMTSKTVLKGVAGILLGYSVASAIVELKSLIFNLYDMAITQAKKFEIDEQSKPKPKA